MNRGPASSKTITPSAIRIKIRLRRVSFGILAVGRIPTGYAPWSIWLASVTTVRTSHPNPVCIVTGLATGRLTSHLQRVQRVHRLAQGLDLHQPQAGRVVGGRLVAVLGRHQKHRGSSRVGGEHLVCDAADLAHLAVDGDGARSRDER